MPDTTDNKPSRRVDVSLGHRFHGCSAAFTARSASPVASEASVYLQVNSNNRGKFFSFSPAGEIEGAAQFVEEHFPAEAHALAYAAISHFEDVFRILQRQGAE